MNPEAASDIRCSLPRRLAAIVYDGVVMIGVLFAAALPVVLLYDGAVATMHDNTVEASPLFRIYVLLVAFAFYGGFWTHGGQTIGMRAWHIRLVRRDGDPVRWRDAAVRFAAAIVSWLVVGVGFWWGLIDREGLTWHDRWSGTELRRSY